MTLNNHFAYTFGERPTPKLWLCKPDGTRIERIADFSKLGGTFKFTNVNTLHFDLPLQIFSEDTKQIERNKVVDLVKNKYLIDYRYNGYRDIFVIDDIKKSANNSDFITLNLDSRASELNKKAANEIELLGSTIPQMMNKILSIYAPLWKLGHVDGKIIDVKRELTGSNTTVNALIDNICSLFDAVAIYNNIDRTINFYHKDNVGTNRGLRVRENSYLKSFEDQFVSKDIVTRLYPFGQSGLTIQSVNPAGSSYIEDFSYFMSPFKRDNNRNVLQHSDYMSDELCHALLDYQEFYASKKDQAGELSKRYSEILKEHSQEDFRLNQLSATLQRLNERVELIKPKSEYIDLGTKIKNFKITVPKSSYYLIMIRNDGSLARIKFNNKQYNIPSGEWLYIKLKTGKFNDATKFEKQLEYPLEILSANANLRVVYTRSSEGDYEEEDTKKIEEKYNLEKYKTLVKDQEKVVASIERRLKAFEDQRASVTRSMNAKNFLSEKLYNERELYVFESVWTEENHTDAQELYDDAVKQMKEQKKINRTITVDLVNFIQSLDHKDDWDKLNVGDKVIFQNKIFNTKIKAYITEMQLDFETNQVKITISDIFDYKDLDTIIAEKLAQTTSTSSQVNFHKQQIREQTGRITDMTRLIEGEWDANKKRVMAGNETVDIGSHGVKVISKDNPNEFVIMVGGVIAMTRDNGETFKTGITPEGINAEMLIGKMIVGETLTFENESGTVKFDKDGLYVNSKNFHLVSNDGEENYFDKLKREMSENAKQQTDRMLEEYKKEVSQTISEATDVRNIVDNAADILQAAFADGVITDVEKRLISETLAQLEKENREFEDKINLALNHPYITEEDTIELNNSIIEYSSMYETLIISINESVSDKMITPQESEEINQNIVNFREEIKDILSLVEEVIERTKNAQLQATLEEAKDYTTRVRDDIKDELNDLNNSFKSLNSTVEESLKDNIFDAAELEAIKTVVLVTKSEYQDITNRYSSMAVNTDLKSESKSDLTKAYKTLDTSFNDFVKYIDEMTMDRIADESEKANYKTKYDTLQKNLSDYMKKYDNCILEISKKYSNDAADKVLGDFTAIATELQNDFQDVKDNWAEFKQTTLESFKDGIVTETEKARLRVQLDMLDRESMDIEERYKSLLANQYTDTNIKNRLAASRSPYLSAHASLRQAIEQIIADGQVDESEKTLANNSLNTYNTTLTAYSKAIQEALNTLSQIISSDVASKKVEEFNGVITTISSDVDTIKKQRDGSVITYYYSGVPTLSNDPAKSWTTNELKDLHIKDMYLDTKSGYAYTFTKSGTSYSWKPLTDQVIVSSLKQAKNAQDTADNKRRVFVTQPTPPYDQGDMWTQGSQGDIYVCGTSRATGSFVSSDWVKASKYTDDTVAKQAAKDLEDYKVKMTKDFKDLNDGVSTFKTEVIKDFKDGIVTEAEKTRLRVQLDILDRESQDIEERYNSIFNSQYADTQVKTSISKARSTYNTSLTNLRNTIQTIIEDGEVTSTEKTTANQTLTTYNNALTSYSTAIQEALNSMSKIIAQKEATNQVNQFNEVINNINTNITDIQKQVDGAIETFYYNGVPTLTNIPASDWTTASKREAHLGDLYLDTATGIAYRFLKKGTTSPTYYWSQISDQILTDAMNRAKTAQDTADGKRRVFVKTPVPPYDTGDMWTQGASGDILVCQTPKAKGGIYSISDWVKASKYTDDTVANSAVQQLNEYKRTNNLDIADLKRKTSDFEKTVVNAFDDRVISISESSSIKGQLALLNHEKDRLTRQYENIIGNSNLVGAEKAKLSTAYSNMNTKLSDLSTTINSAIVDNKIVDAESKSVTSKFELYKASVNEYQLAFDNALNSIIREIASSQAKDRLDEWKRTEFSTDSDGIIERVAGAKFDSKWTDTWRDTVNPAISKVQSSLNDTNNKISGLKTGGVNLLQSYREETKAVIDPSITNTKKASFDRLWATPLYKPDYFRNYLQPDTEYTISYEIQIDNFNGAETLRGRSFGILLYDYTDAKVLSNFTVGILPETVDPKLVGKKFKATETFTTPSSFENNLNFLAYAGYYQADDGSRIYPSPTISNLKLETGNIASDWTPAPEDSEQTIIGITSELKDFKKDTEKFIKDGSVSLAEAKSIATHIKTLTKERKDIDAKFNSYIGNNSISPENIKDLKNSKATFDNASNSLKSIIESASNDREIDTTEKKNIEAQFDNYNTAVANLRTSFEAANDSISSGKISNIRVAGRNLVKSSNVKVEGSSYTLATFDLTDNIPEGTEVTLAVKANLGSDRSYLLAYNSGGRVSLAPLTNSMKNADGVYISTFNWRITNSASNITASNEQLYIYQAPQSASSASSIEWIKLEYGNTFTGWSPAPEDSNYKLSQFDATLDKIGKDYDTFKKDFDSFSTDGVINAAEYKAIESQLNILNKEKAEIDSKYDAIFKNEKISTVAQNNLKVAKYSFDTNSNALISNINKVITDKKVVNTERPTINASFVNYSKALSTLRTSFEAALDSIGTTKVDDLSQSTSKEIQTVKNTQTNFKRDYDNFVRDGVFTKAEVKSLETTIKLINKEKADLDSKYTAVSTNPSVSAYALSTLRTIKSAYDSALSTLTTAINNVIRKKDVTDTDRSNIENYFNTYSTAISNLRTAFENAFDSISTTKVDNIKVGGRNLLKKTTQRYLQIPSSYCSGIVQEDGKRALLFNNSNDIIYLGGSEYALEKDETYTFSFYAKASEELSFVRGVYISVGNSGFIPETIITTNWKRYSFTFTATNNNSAAIHMYPVIKNSDGTYKSFYITDWQLEKGTIATDVQPSLDETAEQLENYDTRISSAETFIEKNKDKISQIATKTDVDASLSKVATYETQYSVSSGSNYQIPLQEYNGSFFTDNYTYEVVAKNNSLSSNNVATAIFVSKGSNNGYELVELDNMSKTGANPKFVLDSKGRPSISTFSPQSATQDISVIYTKYLGSASAINTTKSLIEQTASSIELQVKKLTAETEYNNILLNSDFSSGWEGWIYVDPQFSIVDKNTFGYTRFDTIENKTKKYNTIKMAYNKNTNYPSVFSNFISVGKGQEVAIGEDLTLSCYAYIPSSSKGQLTGNVYIELNGYFDKDQRNNPSLAKHYINTEDFEYDKWFRMTATATIPATIPDGRKMNYIRAGLRYSAKTQSVNDQAIFYYALPQLERGSKPTEWSLSRLDVFSTEQLAAKIALNPESVDIIARNIDFNTDSMKIYNSNGTLNISGDTLTISNNNSSNEVIINPNGFTLKKDGVVKFKNGLDTSDYNVQAYEPQFSSWNDLKATHSAASSKYNYVRHIEPGMNGYYTVNTGVYKFAAQYNQLVESSGKKNARVNRYTYLYNKRYLKVQMSALSQGKSKLYIRFLSTTGGTLFHEEVVSSTSTTFPDVTIDLQAKLGYPPNNKPDFFEVQAGIAYGEDNSIDGYFRIRRMALTDTPNAEV